MKRHRLGSMSGLFFTNWQGYSRTGDENFGYSREYQDAVTQGMLEGERLEQKKTRDAAAGNTTEVIKPDEVVRPVNQQNCL